MEKKNEERNGSGITFTDLVLSVLPWPFHKDLPVPRDEEEEKRIKKYQHILAGGFGGLVGSIICFFTVVIKFLDSYDFIFLFTCTLIGFLAGTFGSWITLKKDHKYKLFLSFIVGLVFGGVTLFICYLILVVYAFSKGW